MNLDFLNDYWLTCMTQEGISSNKHFISLDKCLISEIESPGIREDPIKTMYRGTKRWDMHFPQKEIAIEYKSISEHIGASVCHRTDEAIGSAIDLKHLNPDYKLGYLLVFAVKNKIEMNPINRAISAFDKMVKNNIYDYFCPLLTYGKDNHEELSTDYTFERFITEIKNKKETNINPLFFCLE